ncbi:MAG: molybdenum ABC transporter ATP-binding protein [Alphaproteobacteria bacterium]
MTLEVRVKHQFAGFALDVDFSTGRGVTAIFGPSGSGKTTIINAVAGLFHPRACRIVVDGEVLADIVAQRFVPPRLRRMGYVFQDSRLFPHLSVRDNLAYGSKRSTKPATRAELDSVISLLGLDGLLARRPRNLSGGEKQRVALGRALLSSPRLLLLDEPLAALGQAMKDEILPYLVRLRDEAKVPMLYVSHSVDEVARIADELVLLEAGHVTAQGSVFDLFSSLSPAAEALADGAIIEARVAKHLPEEQLSELAFGNAQLLVPAVPNAAGSSVRIRILSRDITIALDPPGRISANNVLAVTVGEIRIVAAGEADVQLLAGDARLVARITRYSLGRLALAPGMKVYAIIKSVTVDRRAL